MYDKEGIRLSDNWYAIRAAEKYESKAVGWCFELMEYDESFASLKAIEEFKIPKDVDGKPIIPGYIFIKVDLVPAIYYQLPKVPLMGHWVGIRMKKLTKRDIKRMGPMGANYPEPLTEEDLERLKKIELLFTDKNVNEEIISRNLIPGAFYKVTGGPMKGATAIFHEVDSVNENRVHVSVLVFGQPVKTMLNITDIGNRHDYDFQ